MNIWSFFFIFFLFSRILSLFTSRWQALSVPYIMFCLLGVIGT